MENSIQIGDWTKISVLGSGAFGEVLLFRNEFNNDFIAIKRCKLPFNMLSDKHKQRWHNEVQIMKSLQNPNIVRYKELPVELEKDLKNHNASPLPLLPMEYCQKGNLRYVLREPKNLCGLEEVDVRYLLLDITHGLTHLHSLNITHRDIKPENIVLQHCNDRMNNTIYKIIDLGYAKELNNAVVSFVGTLHYLAPEIFMAKQYDYSVDFWSFGILTFEVVCGVLPFLPHQTPFDRFEKIKDKGPNDICIYMSHAGGLSYSSELKKEHHISTCLKQDLEVWLRHVLQFDPKKRQQNFPNNVCVLDQLKQIVSKRIVHVFYFHKMEFYSYEINDSILLSTLKDWISRDIKVNKNHFVLLVSDEVFGVDDDVLLKDILHETTDIYVFKQGCFFNEKIPYNFPKLVKEIFKSNKIDAVLFKQLYAQCLFYLSYEIKLSQAVLNGFKLYVKYAKFLSESLREKRDELSRNIRHILIKVECYTKLRRHNICDIDLGVNREYKDCLACFQRLLSVLDRNVQKFNALQNKIVMLLKCQKYLEINLPTIEAIIQSWDPLIYYKEIIGTPKEEKSIEIIVTRFRKIIFDAIKNKDNMFINKQLLHYARYVGVIVNSTEKIMAWVVESEEKSILELSESFDQMAISYHRSIINNAKNNKCKVSSDGHLPSTDELIAENQNIRYDLSACFLDLEQRFVACKKFMEQSKNYLY